MEIFLQVSLAFPTVIFSFLLCLAVLYWVVVAFGLIEIDVLDVEADSALEGPAAALLSKLKLRDVPLTLVGGIGYLIAGSVDIKLLAMLLAGSIPGIVIGSRLTTVLDERFVQRSLAVILFLAGLKMVLS